MKNSLNRYNELSKEDNAWLEEYIIYRDIYDVARERGAIVSDNVVEELKEIILDFYNEDSKTNFPLSYSTRFITDHYLDRDITINDLKESSYSDIYDAIDNDDISILKNEDESEDEMKEYLEYDNKKYELKVSMYDDTNLLKVSMIDIETNESKEITLSGTELVIPPAPTPDCVMIDAEGNEQLVDTLLKLNILDYCNFIFAKFNMEELYKYDKSGVKEFLQYHAHVVSVEDNENDNDIKDELER